MIRRTRETRGPSERRIRRQALRSRVAVATAAASMLALPFMAAAPVAAQQQPAGASAPMAPNIPVDPTRAASVGIGQVAANPGAYQGREVMLEGRIRQTLGPRSFTVVDVRGSGAELPVVGNGMLVDNQGRPVNPSAHADDFVTIVGTVRPFNLQQFEESLAVDLNDQNWQPWAGRPAIVASEVTPFQRAAARQPATAPGRPVYETDNPLGNPTANLGNQQGQAGAPGPVDIPGPAGGRGPVGMPGSTGRFQGEGGAGAAANIPSNPMPATVTPLNRVATNPNAVYGEEIRVQGIVDQILGPRSFTIIDPERGSDIVLPVVSNGMMIGPEGLPIPASYFDNQLVSIVGTVHPFALEAIEFEVAADLDDSAWRQFEGRPVIVASEVDLIQGGTEQQPQLQRQGAAAQAGQPGAPPDDIGANVQQDLPATQMTSVELVASNPSNWYGRRLTVFGTIGDVLGPRTFVLDDDDLLAADQVLVVAARQPVGRGGQPLDLTTLGGPFVYVTGTVLPFDEATFEERLGIDLNDQRVRGWAGRPALIAESISTQYNPFMGQLPLTGPVTGGPITGPVTGGQNAPVSGTAQQPAQNVGQNVTIQGPVVERLGPQAFVVADENLGNRRMLVFATRWMVSGEDLAERRSLQPGDVVRATGTVRSFDPLQIEREYNIAVDEERFVGWEGGPVVMATSIQPQTTR